MFGMTPFKEDLHIAKCEPTQDNTTSKEAEIAHAWSVIREKPNK
jgi:hypothetical protein